MTVPAEVLLAFIDQTGANPVWLLSGEGDRYTRGDGDAALSGLSPIQLIRRGLEKLEQQPDGAVVVPSDQLPSDVSSRFVAVSLIPLADLRSRGPDPDRVEGQVLAYRDWLPHPRDTVAVRLDDDAMFPILPAGSVVAVDRSSIDPRRLQGKMVAALADGVPVIRWLELSGKHLIFRPNQVSRDHPLLPMALEDDDETPILGQVVWSWSCFSPVSN